MEAAERHSKEVRVCDSEPKGLGRLAPTESAEWRRQRAAREAQMAGTGHEAHTCSCSPGVELRAWDGVRKGRARTRLMAALTAVERVVHVVRVGTARGVHLRVAAHVVGTSARAEAARGIACE